jgi:uncharacterized FlaG/YvyC family protein
VITHVCSTENKNQQNKKARLKNEEKLANTHEQINRLVVNVVAQLRFQSVLFVFWLVMLLLFSA